MLLIYLFIGMLSALMVSSIVTIFTKNKYVVASCFILGLLGALLLTNLYIAPQFYARTFASELRSSDPFFDLVATKSPAEFNTYVKNMQENILNRDSAENNYNVTTNFMTTLLLKYGEYASDQSLYHYLQADVAFDIKLFALKPNFVLYHEFSDKFTDEISQDDWGTIFAAEKQNDVVLKTTKAVISSGIARAKASPTDAEIQQSQSAFQIVLAVLMKKYGKENVLTALTMPENPGANKTLSAKIIIAFYTAILAGGEQNTGLILRASFKNSSLS